MNLFHDSLASPLGDLSLVFEGERLRALDFRDCEPRMLRLLRLHYGPVALAEARAPDSLRAPLTAFFAGEWAGERTGLDALPVETGGTPFQRIVWAALRRIPPGTTMSYGALAAAVGRPGASRAVGLANGANPVAIVVPCHRVIGADARLTGYAGGLARKHWLIEHERTVIARGLRPAVEARLPQPTA